MGKMINEYCLNRKLENLKNELYEVREGIIELRVQGMIVRDKIKECKAEIRKVKK